MTRFHPIEDQDAIEARATPSHIDREIQGAEFVVVTEHFCNVGACFKKWRDDNFAWYPSYRWAYVSGLSVLCITPPCQGWGQPQLETYSQAIYRKMGRRLVRLFGDRKDIHANIREQISQVAWLVNSYHLTVDSAIDARSDRHRWYELREVAKSIAIISKKVRCSVCNRATRVLVDEKEYFEYRDSINHGGRGLPIFRPQDGSAIKYFCSLRCHNSFHIGYRPRREMASQNANKRENEKFKRQMGMIIIRDRIHQLNEKDK